MHAFFLRHRAAKRGDREQQSRRQGEHKYEVPSCLSSDAEAARVMSTAAVRMSASVPAAMGASVWTCEITPYRDESKGTGWA
ncbi:hypothetical protein [Paenibacillus dendritiformis]|uniref:hypothetical protein n=1 Tax=Paenibacillus dendritiformis TaxID=130049 RepID=UPI001FF0C0A9|nr:hypothetical protein [Paenibacillus dendritiformis]